MKVQVLGTGCARCDNLYDNVVEAIGRIPDTGEHIMVEKEKDPKVFVRMGVTMTPGLVISGEVVSMGKVLTSDEVETELLKRRAGETA